MDEVQVPMAVSKIQHTPHTSGTRILTHRSESHEGEHSPTSITHKKRKKVKRKKRLDDISPESFEVPGVSKIVITPAHQKIIECSVGDEVTLENPWKYVPKTLLLDNSELQQANSTFVPIKKEILKYPGEELLLGYIPDETRDYDEFYICLTEPAERMVTEIIEKIRKKQEERLHNSILKKVKPWISLGSEVEVDDMQVKNNRLLLQVEIETEYPIRGTECRFELKLAKDVIGCYAEMVPRPTLYSNLCRKKIDAGTQVTPFVKSNEAQTVYPYPVNAWTQYEYQYEPIEDFSTDFIKSVQSFAKNEMDSLFNKICVNSNIHFYDDDYLSLIKEMKYTKVSVVATIKEYASMIEEKLCTGKQISCINWHPMWTGTVAISYSDEASSSYIKYQPNRDDVNEATYNVTPVLIWNFKDNLTPRLILETSREVNVISFCPHNENILVGGCINGQVIVWDIRNRIESVEAEELLSSVQKKYRTLMFSLTKWMKNIKKLNRVGITAVSELMSSHGSCVTDIRWLSPFREMSRSGIISEISEEENRNSIQFMTCARDGVVLTWDLQAKPLTFSSTFKPPRRLTRLKKRPSALSLNISPYKQLHKVFTPVFKIKVIDPTLNRNLVLSSLSIRFTAPQYVERYSDSERIFNITDRILFDYVFNKPKHPLQTGLIAGTTEGDFVVASWDGFQPNEEEVPNEENAKIINCAKYHDGPVVSLARSELFPDLCLTVGGNVFALWKTTFSGKPVLWRRSKYRYTHGCWNSYRPSIFRLTRSDGCLEVWHLKTRSDRYQDLTDISGKGLTGTFSHPRPMQQNILGIGDTQGALRLFYTTDSLTQATEEDNSSTYKICEREANRKAIFIKWQEGWMIKNAEYVKTIKDNKQRIQQQKDDQIKAEKKKVQEAELLAKQEAERIALLEKRQPGRHAEWAQRQWALKEKERLNKVLLTKKGLDINLLEKQKLPLIKLSEEKEKKKRKQEERLSNASKIFNNTVSIFFSDAIEKKPPVSPDPYEGGDSLRTRKNHFENYVELEEKTQDYVDTHPYVHHFDWLQTIKSGRQRRRLLDGYYLRTNHRNRTVKETVREHKIEVTLRKAEKKLLTEDSDILNLESVLAKAFSDKEE